MAPEVAAARPATTSVRGAAVTAVIATLVTIAMAWPVLRSPRDRLFGAEIVGRHHDAFTVIAQFETRRPLGPYTQPATDWLGWLVARATGAVAAYNLLTLASFPLAAATAYALARHFRYPTGAAGAVGLAYAFSAFHVAQAAYHVHIAQVQWLPLYLLALFRSLDRWRPTTAVATLAAAAVTALASFYYALFIVILTPFAIAAYAWLGRPRRAAIGATVATLVAGAGAGGAYLWWFAPAALTGADAALRFPRSDLFIYSARWWSYLLPPVDGPLAGSWVRALWDDHGIGGGLLEQQLYLGYGPLALAAVAIWAWLVRSERDHGTAAVPLFVLLAAVALACSLSPERQYGDLRVLRPTALLYVIAPMFRAYARLGVVVQLMVGLLAAAGATRLWRTRNRYGRALVMTLAVITAIELTPFPPWRWHPLLPTAAHRWIAAQAGPLRLLDCAPRTDAAARSALPHLTHPATLRAAPAFADCSEPQLAGKLAAEGFSHVLIHRASPEGAFHARHEPAAGLVVAARFEDSLLLRVEADPAPIYVSALTGFSWREYADGASYRWMGQRGELIVRNRGHEPRRVSLELELNSFPAPRQLIVTQGSTQLASLRVATDRRAYTVGPMTLPPGESRLSLVAGEPPAIPDEVTGNGDRRAVTVALASWRWLAAQAP